VSALTGRLLDLWLPPEGAGRPLGCVATTFTFEADFFEQQCLGRFLGLDTRPGEAATDIGYLIEREEKLAETPVCVIADRSLNPDSRSLRWDVLPVRARTGVMHAKVSVLVWEHAVRLITASANLVERAYRRSIELATVFDAARGTQLWLGVFDELLDAVEGVVRLGPPARAEMGPRPRALAVLARARDRIASFDLPSRPRRGMPRLAVVMPGADGDAIDGLMRVWGRGVPRRATVMSPYFDMTGEASRAAERLGEILSTRGASAAFVVPFESERNIVGVPAALLNGLPARIDTTIFDVKQPDESELRGLHGKLVLLESDDWIAALVGSSNFSAAGLGLDRGGNVEIGIAVGAAQDSSVGAALRGLALAGISIDIDAVGYEPVEDPDETLPAVPAGFVQALGDPGPPAQLEIELVPSGLPEEWEVTTPDGKALLGADEWRSGGRKRLNTIPAPDGDLPFNLTIVWCDSAGVRNRLNLPVNVTDPGRLMGPAELRTLPVDVLLRALASVRPMHEAVTDALERQARSRGLAASELDPLKRFSPTGQLLHRTRELSEALAGLRGRLERPAATMDTFVWRIEGPFGPVAIARKLIEERHTNREVEGEAAFMLAEVALTLARVDLGQASRFAPRKRSKMREVIREAVAELEALRPDIATAPNLAGYVDDAFARATR
jgi:hypothetical protein